MTDPLERLKKQYQLQKLHTHITPIIESTYLSRLINGNVVIKAESLQKTGAFKFRGALSRLLALSDNEKENGVIAYSSGNFARGLAAAGRILNIKTHLVMPADAPDNKITNAQKEGAEVTLCHSTQPSREEAASQLAAQQAQTHGYTLLHPFDDPLIIEGQASVTLEWLEQLSNHTIDSLLCPTGGGSLVCGASMALKLSNIDTDVYAIEPKGFNGLQKSMTAQQLCRAQGNPYSSCDALQARNPGRHNFSLAKDSNIKCLSVSEAFVIDALKLAFSEMKLVLEPSGVIGIAAVLEHSEEFSGKNVVIIATGGNVDPKLFCQLLQKPH